MATPETTIMVESVAMIGTMPSFATASPLINPIAVPAARMSRMTKGTVQPGPFDEHRGDCRRQAHDRSHRHVQPSQEDGNGLAEGDDPEDDGLVQEEREVRRVS